MQVKNIYIINILNKHKVKINNITTLLLIYNSNGKLIVRIILWKSFYIFYWRYTNKKIFVTEWILNNYFII